MGFIEVEILETKEIVYVNTDKIKFFRGNEIGSTIFGDHPGENIVCVESKGEIIAKLKKLGIGVE